MFRIEQLIDSAQAQELLGLLRSLDDAWFVDRESHFQNMDLEGRPSKYDCLTEHCMPEEVSNILDRISPQDVDEVIINRYKTGMCIPRHQDGCVSPEVSVLALEEGHNVLRIWQEGEMIEIPDRAGQLVTIGCTVEHEVLPVQSERFSIVFLRGMASVH